MSELYEVSEIHTVVLEQANFEPLCKPAGHGAKQEWNVVEKYFASAEDVLFFSFFFFVLLRSFSTPIGEWPSPPPTPCRTCRTPLSTATMIAVWRNQRLPAASRRLVLASGRWPCLRTTMREPLQMAALERPSTLKMVRWHVAQFLPCSPWICI